jgi:hypothetical protein
VLSGGILPLPSLNGGKRGPTQRVVIMIAGLSNNRQLLVCLLLLAFWAPPPWCSPRSTAVSADSSGECFSSLTDIYELEAALTDDSLQRVYSLCRGYTYAVGGVTTHYTSHNTTEVVNDGKGNQRPLFLARSNLKIQCGGADDAQSTTSDDRSQACAIVPGSSASAPVQFIDEFNTLQPVINVQLVGITFEGGSVTNILAQHQGDLKLTDCVFVVCLLSRIFLFAPLGGLSPLLICILLCCLIAFSPWLFASSGAIILQGKRVLSAINILDPALNSVERATLVQSEIQPTTTVTLDGCIFRVCALPVVA